MRPRIRGEVASALVSLGRPPRRLPRSQRVPRPRQRRRAALLPRLASGGRRGRPPPRSPLRPPMPLPEGEAAGELWATRSPTRRTGCQPSPPKTGESTATGRQPSPTATRRGRRRLPRPLIPLAPGDGRARPRLGALESHVIRRLAAIQSEAAAPSRSTGVARLATRTGSPRRRGAAPPIRPRARPAGGIRRVAASL